MSVAEAQDIVQAKAIVSAKQTLRGHMKNGEHAEFLRELFNRMYSGTDAYVPGLTKDKAVQEWTGKAMDTALLDPQKGNHLISLLGMLSPRNFGMWSKIDVNLMAGVMEQKIKTDSRRPLYDMIEKVGAGLHWKHRAAFLAAAVPVIAPTLDTYLQDHIAKTAEENSRGSYSLGDRGERMILILGRAPELLAQSTATVAKYLEYKLSYAPTTESMAAMSEEKKQEYLELADGVRNLGEEGDDNLVKTTWEELTAAVVVKPDLLKLIESTPPLRSAVKVHCDMYPDQFPLSLKALGPL